MYVRTYYHSILKKISKIPNKTTKKDKQLKYKQQRSLETTMAADSDSDSDFEDAPLASLKTKKKRVATPTKVKSNGKIKPDKVKSSAPKKGVSNGKSRKRVKKEEDDFETKPSKKKVKIKKENGSKEPAKRALKKLDKAQRMAHAMQAFLWWDAPEPPEGCQWSTMEHAGVSFTDAYIPHGVKLKYDGKDVDLSPVEEEA